MVAQADDGDGSQTNLDHAPGVVRKEPKTSEQSRRRKRDAGNIDDQIDDLLEALSNIVSSPEVVNTINMILFNKADNYRMHKVNGCCYIFKICVVTKSKYKLLSCVFLLLF